MRRKLSTTQRLALFLAAQGQCQACGWRLTPGQRWEVDHIVPMSLGGRHQADNLQVLCAACHGSKTNLHDRPVLSKAKRLQSRHLGAVRSRTTIPGSRRSKWRKRMDGTVVLRRANSAL